MFYPALQTRVHFAKSKICQQSASDFANARRSALGFGMLQERDGITLHGLSSRPDLNGRTGTLVRWHDERQRWAVELDESVDIIWVKPENLSLQEPEAALEAALTPELCAGARAWLSQPVEVVTKARERSVLYVLLTLTLALTLTLTLTLTLARCSTCLRARGRACRETRTSSRR